MMADDMQDLLGEQFEQLMRARCTESTVREIEAGGDARPLWRALQESGFADALRTEAEGGAGLSLADAYSLVEACGRHALPLPFAQTVLARAWLAEAGAAMPDGPIALATASTGPAGEWACAPVAEGMWAEFALVQCDKTVALLALSSGVRTSQAPGTGMARVAWPAAAVAAPLASFPAVRESLPVQAAVLAAQISGAATHVFRTTLQYANDRSQFGRSIGKFQAVQHQISVMAEQAALMRGAARFAFRDGERFPDPLRAAIAKSLASEAATQIAAIAHAVHGAIGITGEYALQMFTRRLHEWRLCGASESYWNDRIGQAALGTGHGLVEFVRRAAGDAPID